MNTSKKTMGRFTAVLLTVLVIAAAFCLPVSAAETTYTLPDVGMTLTLPEGAQILTPTTPADDPVWDTAKVSDVDEKIAQMSEDGIQAEIYAFDGACTIAVSAKSSDYSQEIFDLNNLNEEEKADFLERMQPSSMATGSVEWYDNETIPFFRIDIQSEAVEEGQTVYERLYGTVFDGVLVAFDLYNGTEEISEEYDALMRQIVDSVALPKSAETTYTLPDVGMTLTLPEGAQILTPTTPADDPVWGTAKVLDTTEKITQMNEDGILAEIYAFDGACTIAVSAKSSDYSQAIFNLNYVDEDAKADFMERMKPSSMDGRTTGSAEWYDNETIPFFRIDIQSEAVEEGQTVHERLYGTIFDGTLVALDLYNGAEEIPEEYDALMRQIVDTAVFPEFQPEPSAEVTPEMVWMLVVLGLLIALIVGFFVYRSVVNRRDKREKHAMADRLAAYRQSKLGHEDEGDGALRFVNETEHSDNAIKVFANFQAYRRRLFAPLFTILIGLVALYVVAQSSSGDGWSDNWWILLLLAACIVYSVYKIATASTSVTKAMIRSYSKMRSRKAAYYFYEGDFRITGLQASNLHPYFQITRMYETKEYFYMYFGEENTYFIAKDGFEQGDAESFREFMREKIGKRLK